MEERDHGHDPTPEELKELKARLKSGKMTAEDLKTLENLVQKTERSAANLRAAVVE